MNNNDSEVTEVVFRILNGEVIAMFPYIPEKINSTCLSYMHIGQHGIACLSLIKETKFATLEEYQDLFNELENIGYNLKVIKPISISYKKYKKLYNINRLKLS